MTTNTRPELIFEIKGAFFHKPAVSILKNLAINTPMVLYPEPWNTHDPNAIAVYLHKDHIDKILDKIKMSPDTTIEYTKNNEFHIGYLAAVDVANLKFDRSRTILGEFRVSSNNKPMVKLTGFRK